MAGTRVEDAVERLAALSGIGLESCEISRRGFVGRGARIMGFERGRGLLMSLTRSLGSAEAVIFPEESAGALVRQISRNIERDPISWRGSIEHAQLSGAALMVSVNDQTLDDPMELPEDLWHGFVVECNMRVPARPDEGDQDTLVMAGALALAIIFSSLVDSTADQADEMFALLADGARTNYSVSRYERNPANRLRCLTHYKPICWACDLQFEERYGPIGVGFIEVHHRRPLATSNGEVLIDPIRDLVPLCSNCHSMAHRYDPPVTPQDLRTAMGLPVKDPPLPDLPPATHSDIA